MKLFAIILLISANYFWVVCYGGYVSTKHCTGYGEDLYYEIICNDPIPFPNDLPKHTEKLTILCSKNATDNNNTLTAITQEDVNQYEMLISITIQNCPIVDLPEKVFSNLHYLQSVILDGLPIKRLRNIFHKTENILELGLMNLFNLEHIDHHILDSQKAFSRIIIDHTMVLPDNIKQILQPVQLSLKEFRMINNRPDVIEFPLKFFDDYRLGLLDLQNNYLRDWSFLNITKSRKIILTKSQAANSFFDLSMYQYLPIFCELLNLESIGLVGVFPRTVSASFDHTKILIAKYNSIETLHNDTDKMFPHLQMLDISNNRIKRLQPDLNNLFYKTEFFKLEGNPLHCNCQLRWLSARYKAKIKDFPRCNFAYRNPPSTNKSQPVENLYFFQLATDNLICLPPRAPVLTISRGEKPTRVIFSAKDFSENATQIKKEYTLIIDPHQSIELICETQGDPTPTLTWSNKSGLILTRDASSQIDHSSNRLTVGVGGTNVSSIYMCTASNIEGISYALLNLVSKKEEDELNAMNKRLIAQQSGNNGAAKQIAQIFEYSWNFVWKILFFATGIVVNIYFF